MRTDRTPPLQTARDILSYASLIWRRFRPAIFQPRQFIQLIRVAHASLKAGGLSALTGRFLERVQTTADYRRWVCAYDTLTDTDRAAIRRHIDQLANKPLISVVMPTYNTPERWLRLAIESVRKQLYPHWELCIADDASSLPQVRRVLEEYRAQDPRIRVVWRERSGHISTASNSALEIAQGAFIALLDHDDELAEQALYRVAVELNAHPDAEIIYSDEDKISEEGRRYDPYFKPDWNPDLFCCQNFVSHLGVYRRSRVRTVGGFQVGYEGSQDWDLAMRMAEQTPASHIRHIPSVLYHWRAIAGSTALAMEQKSYVQDAQARLLIAHFQRRGETVDVLPTITSHWRVRYPLPKLLPFVSLIILNHGDPGRLRRCVEGICQRTTYLQFELLVVGNRPAIDEPQVRVVYAETTSSEAAMYNYAVQHARGEVIGLLSGRLEVISPTWLDEMVSHALRPEVGTVGAILYYPNDTIQHAGIILGGGDVAREAYAHKPRGYTGQIGRAILSQNLSAVSATCLVLRRTLFLQVGGFDDKHLASNLYDIDLCLRLAEQGYRTVWTPYAELYHHTATQRESSQRGEHFRAEAAYLRQRWGTVLAHDPAYNPNLALAGETFRLAFPPQAQRPWMEAPNTSE